jgi:hypothetical protein
LDYQRNEKPSIALRIHVLKGAAPFLNNKRLKEATTATLSDFAVRLGGSAAKGKPSPTTIKRNFLDLKQFSGWRVKRG